MAARLAAPWPEGITPDLHRALLADFVTSLRERRPPTVGSTAAVRIQRQIDGIYAAAGSGLRTAVAR